jgi:arylsulfatase A-like enzyme
MRSGIVVVVEGVNTGLVGAYGTNTAVTPAIDRLAAHGLVLDQCFVDSLDSQKQLYSLWTGRHAAQDADPTWSMWQQVQSDGYEACLITDCPVAAQIAEQLGCPRVTLIEADTPQEPAEDWTECALMRVFVAAVEELSESESKRLVWIHSRGLRHAWDAPLELRERFIDPEDPEPPSEACVPDISVTKETDPDEIIGWGQVAAAQVAVVDQAIDILVSTIESREDADQWVWMLASPGGVPLGEHGRVGWGMPQLHGEELSCLAIVRPSGAQPLGSRRAELCQLPDLLVTLMDAMGINVPATAALWGKSMLRLGTFSAPQHWPAYFQSACVFESADDQWIRTPAWSVTSHSGRPPKLFVKPDDRWEVSDVSSRRSDIVERLQEIAREFRECLRTGQREQLSQLEDELGNLLR